MAAAFIDALPKETVADLAERIDRQYEAEQALGALRPDLGPSNKQVLPNLVNKGRHYLDLVEHATTHETAAFVGKTGSVEPNRPPFL